MPECSSQAMLQTIRRRRTRALMPKACRPVSAFVWICSSCSCVAVCTTGASACCTISVLANAVVFSGNCTAWNDRVSTGLPWGCMHAPGVTKRVSAHRSSSSRSNARRCTKCLPSG
jgi:hypothetical protein